jgi:hypothetical protein
MDTKQRIARDFYTALRAGTSHRSTKADARARLVLPVDELDGQISLLV